MPMQKPTRSRFIEIENGLISLSSSAWVLKFAAAGRLQALGAFVLLQLNRSVW
jgi:hypothetical protein